MKILCLRHGIAEDVGPGRSDEERQLTAEGRDKTRLVAQGISRIVEKFDVIVSSPYIRAVQTADLLAEQFRSAERKTSHLLTPNSTPAGMLAACRELGAKDYVALVGHEPVMSSFICEAVTGEGHCFINLKKASACLLDFSAANAPSLGVGEMLWFLQPKQLRLLGGGE